MRSILFTKQMRGTLYLSAWSRVEAEMGACCWTGPQTHAGQEQRSTPVTLLTSCYPVVAAASHLAPHSLGLGLHTRHRVKHGNGTVQHAQRTLHLRFSTEAAGMRGQNAAGGGLQDSTFGMHTRHTVMMAGKMPRSSRAALPALVQLPATE